MSDEEWHGLNFKFHSTKRKIDSRRVQYFSPYGGTRSVPNDFGLDQEDNTVVDHSSSTVRHSLVFVISLATRIILD